MGNLYIIGNGFDIAHGLKTRWADFRDFLVKEDKDLYEKVSDFFKSTILWSDFEAALSSPDKELVSDLHKIFGIDISSCIKEDLHEALKKRIRKISNEKVPKLEKFNFSSFDRFITFNYTPTLELTYSMPAENILHIHGNSGNLIFFYSETKFEFGYDNVELSSDERVANFANTFKKNTTRILKKNIEKINELLRANIDKIIVIGLSYSTADINYFDYIRKNVGNKPWELHYFTEGDLVKLNKYVKNLCITNYKIIKDS